MNFALFAKANSREIQALDECLESYCQWSGQSVNKDKSRLIFSKEIDQAQAEDENRSTNFYVSWSPLFSSRSKCKDFKYLQERLESKLLG
jgi:hypothetical protein